MQKIKWVARLIVIERIINEKWNNIFENATGRGKRNKCRKRYSYLIIVGDSEIKKSVNKVVIALNDDWQGENKSSNKQKFNKLN